MGRRVKSLKQLDVQYPENLHNLHSDLPFLPERKTIKKCEKLACTLQNKKDSLFHIRALKQARNHGLILKKIT